MGGLICCSMLLGVSGNKSRLSLAHGYNIPDKYKKSWTKV